MSGWGGNDHSHRKHSQQLQLSSSSLTYFHWMLMCSPVGVFLFLPLHILLILHYFLVLYWKVKWKASHSNLSPNRAILRQYHDLVHFLHMNSFVWNTVPIWNFFNSLKILFSLVCTFSPVSIWDNSFHSSVAAFWTSWRSNNSLAFFFSLCHWQFSRIQVNWRKGAFLTFLMSR